MTLSEYSLNIPIFTSLLLSKYIFMKSVKLYGIFFLLLCTISFISCSDDNDNPEHHLELSNNSCEVMQGRSVVIDLTAQNVHEYMYLQELYPLQLSFLQNVLYHSEEED